MAAGTAKRSAIAARMSGVRTRREGDLPDRQGRAAGESANDKRANDARAAVEGGEFRRQAREERERVDREREQQPAEEADAGNAQNKSDDEHGGCLRDKGSNGCAFHHHHGALPSIAEDDEGGQRKFGWDFRRRLVRPAPFRVGRGRIRE